MRARVLLVAAALAVAATGLAAWCRPETALAVLSVWSLCG